MSQSGWNGVTGYAAVTKSLTRAPAGARRTARGRVAERRPRRVEHERDGAAERFDVADVLGRRPARERIDAEVGLQLALLEAARGRRRVHHLQRDLLRIEGRVEGDLVARVGRAGRGEPEAERGDRPGEPNPDREETHRRSGPRAAAARP